MKNIRLYTFVVLFADIPTQKELLFTIYIGSHVINCLRVTSRLKLSWRIASRAIG